MILLDTCAIIWDALDRTKLTETASAAIETADEHNALIMCNISIWEISMLIQRGRIQMACSAANFINLYLGSRNLAVVAISPEIAELSTSFGPEITNDLADRIIAATSIIRNGIDPDVEPGQQTISEFAGSHRSYQVPIGTGDLLKLGLDFDVGIS